MEFKKQDIKSKETFETEYDNKENQFNHQNSTESIE
jgi:hypothetical protein